MSETPYSAAPDRAFWSRSVARSWTASDLVLTKAPLISEGQLTVSAGSCFAGSLVKFLEHAGLNYLRTETVHPMFRDLPEEPLGYTNFSAAYGNIYTARQLLQLLRRSVGSFAPVEDHWLAPGAVIDPFRPGLQYTARSKREFDLLTRQHLAKTREAFMKADVFVFTLGLTEAWISKVDGAVFPACPGIIAGIFDPDRHGFINFGVTDVMSDINDFIMEVRLLNPALKIILTVSPVSLAATATNEHVLSASLYSKSVLRVAAAEIAKLDPGVTYFPAYEIICGPQAPPNFFEADRRKISRDGVEAVMSVFLAHCGKAVESQSISTVIATVRTADFVELERATLSKRIAAAECEEVMVESKT
jgi:hypothetical protein